MKDGLKTTVHLVLVLAVFAVAAGALPQISSRTDPSPSWETVTASDTVNFTKGLSRAIYVGTGGDVVAVDAEGGTVTFTNVQSGTTLPLQCIRINSTNSTAANMVALF